MTKTRKSETLKLGHEIRPRALITMYDHRTRYSKQVLQKVKETFGRNVFESAIRYNIRLRETVDHGLPIGDYDKHAIGYKDYESLAEELMRAEAADDISEQPVVDTARDILQNTEEYMDSVKETLEEELSPVDASTGAVYQCASDPVESGESYTSNGPGSLSDTDPDYEDR